MRLPPITDLSSLTQTAIYFFNISEFWLIPTCLFFIAFVLMLLIGDPMIAWLQKKRWKKDATNEETWAVREDTPDTHQAKQGTPSMGGIGIVAATLLSLITLPLLGMASSIVAYGGTLHLPNASWRTVLSISLIPLVLVLHGILGFADDWSKASGRGGLRARAKLAGQIFLAFAFAYIVLFVPLARSRIVPQTFLLDLVTTNSFWMFLLTGGLLMFIVIAVGNAVNLTDGIDGLASGLAIQFGLALLLICVTDGIVRLPMWSSAVAGASYSVLAGACFGFLFFNRYPARVFMGDTGSLAIGAALGAGAILQHAVFLLPFIGFIYFVEMFSVMAQVLWFKYTRRKTGEGKRLFRRAPLHHHFELGGWSEWRVVIVFWIVNLFTSAIGLLLWHMEVLPRWP